MREGRGRWGRREGDDNENGDEKEGVSWVKNKTKKQKTVTNENQKEKRNKDIPDCNRWGKKEDFVVGGELDNE